MNQIKKLKGANILSKKEQGKIQGGFRNTPIGCRTRRDCFIATGEFDWACQINTNTNSGICIPL